MKMTDNVIAQVHAMADKAGIKKYTYHNRYRDEVDPRAWTAGVDYDDYRHIKTDTDDDVNAMMTATVTATMKTTAVIAMMTMAMKMMTMMLICMIVFHKKS
jgi:hypothetical protein